jgi:hypothetical protein
VVGDGPVYAGAFPPNAVVNYGTAPVQAGGWRAFKVLWIVRPAYLGPVLIRSRQLDGPNRIRFTLGGQGSEKRISLWGTAARAAGWGAEPSTEWVRAPGAA